METMKEEFASGTFIERGPFHREPVRGRALCPDGIIRNVRMCTADTFYTMPGVVRCKGKDVTGHCYVNRIDGEAVLRFAPFAHLKNAKVFG